MQIRSHQGVVASLMVQPFAGSEDDFQARNLLFERAIQRSGCQPGHRMDIFDESLVTFDSLEPALDFILELIDLIKHEPSSLTTIRSGLCSGEYFLHGDQIYGAAVNLATQLSFLSRQNEMLTGGIPRERIEGYADKHPGIEYFVRDPDKPLVSLGLHDEDSTLTLFGKSYLHIKSNNHHKILTPQRNIQVSIGRLPTSDIYIDSEHISRQHATLILKDDDLFLEDHSSNGTYVYLDDQEIFLNRNSCQLGRQGIISCGIRRSDDPARAIHFEFRETSEATGEIRPLGSVEE